MIGRFLWRLLNWVHPMGLDVTPEMLAGIDEMVAEQRARDAARRVEG